ncbi:MAG: alanyl-tRNA editing protein [Anaerolineales bacterium]|nr:alanyl-tRNA editing protein [Anaerolineales bacterium]
MTQLLYQTDSYLKSFQATITALDIDQHAAVLDKTAFYPGGGGQPNDTGTMSTGGQSLEVVKVNRTGGKLFHFLAQDTPLPPIGIAVTGQLDWNRRYQLMRTHTAMHILCGVIFRDYGAQVTGGNMEPLQGRMDFEFETMCQELVAEIEAAINAEVEKALPLEVKILPREEAFQIPDLIRTKVNLLPEGINQVRVVEIKGLDLQADGGTHVANTSEVGKITIGDYKSKGKINKRIYVHLQEGIHQ